VPQDDVNSSWAMTLEESAKKRLRSRELFAFGVARLKIGDGGVRSENLKHARVTAGQDRAVDGGGAEGTSLGQLDLTVSFVAKEHAGLLKFFTDLILIHP